MRIYDCFMYSGEDLILDIRLNQNYKFVDYFVIIESKFKHNGEIKTKKFNLDKFEKFKNKIKYFFIEDLPGDLKLIDPTDNLKSQNNRKRDNALIRENFQRNMIVKGLIEANDEDFILIGDIDEIPNLKNLNLTLIKLLSFWFHIAQWLQKAQVLNLIFFSGNFPFQKVILSFYMPVGFTMQCVSIKLQSHPNTGKKNTNLFYMREKKDRILNLLLGM